MEIIEIPECVKHSSLKQEYYCADCLELLCKRCMMESHRLHNYDETEVVVKSLHDSLQDKVQSAKESLKVAEETVTNVETFKAAITTGQDRIKAEIDTFFDQCREQLDQCQTSLMETVDKITENKISSLNVEAAKLTSAQSSFLSAIETLQKLADEKYTVAILSDGIQDIETIEKQTEMVTAIVQSLSEDVSKVELSLQFKGEPSVRVKEALNDLCDLSGKDVTDHPYAILTRKPIDLRLDSVFLDTLAAPSPVYDLPVPVARNLSLPSLSQVPGKDTLKPVSPVYEIPMPVTRKTSLPVSVVPAPKRSLSSTSTSLEPPPLKEPISVISLTQKDRFISENIHPCGIAVGTNNVIIVTDLHSNTVKVLAKTGKVIDTIGNSKGSAPFRGPCAVALDEDNNFFIVERETRRIQKFCNGNLVELAKVSQKLVEPWGIAAGGGKIFVTDWQRCCVHVFEHSGGNKCVYVSSIGNDFLKQPAGIAITPQGNLVVADQENHCVWILTQEGRSIIHPIGGNNVGQFGQLYQPFGVAVTSNGLVIVSDKGSARICVFSQGGELLECFGGKGSQPGELDQPRHLCVNSDGHIVVADELNQRIQIFELS